MSNFDRYLQELLAQDFEAYKQHLLDICDPDKCRWCQKGRDDGPENKEPLA